MRICIYNILLHVRSIPQSQTNTKWWSTTRPQAPCYHYDCGGELEITISHVDVQWKDSPVCYRLGGKLATHIGDVSFGGTDISFLTLNRNLNATTMSLLLYSYCSTSRYLSRWRQNATYHQLSFTDGRYISFHMWLWLGIELENSTIYVHVSFSRNLQPTTLWLNRTTVNFFRGSYSTKNPVLSEKTWLYLSKRSAYLRILVIQPASLFCNLLICLLTKSQHAYIWDSAKVG